VNYTLPAIIISSVFLFLIILFLTIDLPKFRMFSRNAKIHVSNESKLLSREEDINHFDNVATVLEEKINNDDLNFYNTDFSLQRGGIYHASNNYNDLLISDINDNNNFLFYDDQKSIISKRNYDNNRGINTNDGIIIPFDSYNKNNISSVRRKRRLSSERLFSNNKNKNGPGSHLKKDDNIISSNDNKFELYNIKSDDNNNDDYNIFSHLNNTITTMKESSTPMTIDKRRHNRKS
jgi:hypothetical protein